MEVATALDLIGVGAGGITSDEARHRLARFGANALPAAAPKSWFVRFLEQFQNVLVMVLLGSAVITALLGHPLDTAVILGVVVLNAIIGVIQEGKAEAALAAIRDMISPMASVMRDGVRVSVPASEVVPGDLLLLEAGDRVTADVRLTSVSNLRVDEAVLTGESVPVTKSVAPVAADATVGDRTSLAFSGTLVTGGQGAGIVVATGMASELGRISAMIGRIETVETPLIRQMNRLASRLTWTVLAFSAAVLAFAVLWRNYTIDDAFLAVVGMAVAAIPEELPAVMTITLAIGVQRMARRNAIVRRLPAVETLGCVSTICTDKTGTLTKSEMTATTIITSAGRTEVSGVGYAPDGQMSGDGARTPAALSLLRRIAEVSRQCNDASVRLVDGHWTVAGDPMEGALVVLARKLGPEATTGTNDNVLPRLDQIPFDAERRYMATLHEGPGNSCAMSVKGAPERIVAMCRLEAYEGGERPIDAAHWLAAAEDLAKDGHRVLALATRVMQERPATLDHSHVEGELVLAGLVGLIDPPRPEAIAAVADCKSAGIAVKMITGDHAATAGAIAAKLGLGNGTAVVTGAELDQMDDATFRRAIARSSVFARTSPEHKVRLVEASQADGAVIAMTGDGVNDAPALKRSNVGIAMGRNGTEAAKEAADIVLADDNFASIVAAVREGRTVYDNLTKVIAAALPTNGGETIIIVGAILFGVALPMTAAQILWINMVTTVGLGIVLAFEPPEPGIMERPPRHPDQPILSGYLVWRVVLVSALFAVGAFGIFGWATARGHSIEAARTMVVNTVVVMEIFYLFSIRYVHGTSMTWQGVIGTPAVLIGVGAVVVLQLAFTYLPPMQVLFQTASLTPAQGALVIAIGVALLTILEVEKFIIRTWAGRAA